MRKVIGCLIGVLLILSVPGAKAFALNAGVLMGVEFQAQFQDWDASQVYFETNTSLPTGVIKDDDGNVIEGYDSYALIEVTNINRLVGGTLWTEDLPGDSLTGVLYGVDDWSVTIDPDSGIEVIKSTGGFIDLYNKAYTLDPLAAASPTIPYGDTPADAWGATGMPDELFLRLQFVPGVINGDTLTTLKVVLTDFDPVITGTSYGYLKVIGGSAMDIFDTNGYDEYSEGADMWFYDGFSSNNLTKELKDLGWDVGSSGDATGTGIVPEPASMVLMGLGLVGAVLRRKRVMG